MTSTRDRTRPAILLALVASVATLAFAAPAGASQMIDPADGAELLELMQEAAQEQGICYSWSLTLDDQYTYQGGVQDQGQAGSATACAKGSIALTGNVTYSCGTCESGDSSNVSLSAAGLVVPSTDDYLDTLGLDEGDLLSDDKDDVAWLNMVGGLPLMVSAANPSIPPPSFDETVYPSEDSEPLNTPSAMGDWLRTYGWTLVMVVLGLGALVVAGLWYRKQRSTAA